MITTAHAHKSGVIFHFFPRAFKQKKIKTLRPKVTKIASRGSCFKRLCTYTFFIPFFLQVCKDSQQPHQKPVWISVVRVQLLSSIFSRDVALWDFASFLPETCLIASFVHCLHEITMFVCLFVYLFILGRKLNRQNCLLKEVLREREEKEEKENKKSN